MSSSPIKITFFDINGQYANEKKEDLNKNALLEDSPIRILEKYLKENSIQFKKGIVDDLKNYSFVLEFKNRVISFDCYILDNFSVVHQSIVYVNYYIIFCNLDNKDILEFLEKLIEFIKEFYSVNAKIFIIGVFKESIDEDKTYENMKQILDEKHINYEYYEMYDGDLDKIDIESQEYEYSENMNQVFENIFTEIHSPGNKNKKGNIDKKNGRPDKSKCVIF